MTTRVGPAAPESTLDFAMWRPGANQSYAGARNNLFAAIQARRNAFANDARVPAASRGRPERRDQRDSALTHRRNRSGVRGAI